MSTMSILLEEIRLEILLLHTSYRHRMDHLQGKKYKDASPSNP